MRLQLIYSLAFLLMAACDMAGAPAVSNMTFRIRATNMVSGTRVVEFGATIYANGGGDGEAYLNMGPNPAALGSTFPPRYIGPNRDEFLEWVDLYPGVVYHYSLVMDLSSGVYRTPVQTFALPDLHKTGDANGDGIVDEPEANTVLSNYFQTSPWLYMTNVAGMRGNHVIFSLSNSMAGTFGVEYSSNLSDWLLLGLATPRYEFSDTNAPSQQRYYRLRWP